MPPARLTAATTSRQWLKAKIGSSIPNMSVTRVRMGRTYDYPRANCNVFYIGSHPSATSR